MIVKNEENILERCLSSVKDLVDEIIIADTGSDDETKEIAGRFTEKIYDFKWVDDFSAARNFAYSNATMDYILWLDADDIFLPEDASEFKNLKENLSEDFDAVMMRYNTGFDQYGKVIFSYYRERLTKRSRQFQWHEPVHEYLKISGKIMTSEICITHAKENLSPSTSTRNLKIYEKFTSQGNELTPRGTYYYARELKDNGRFTDAVEMFSKFLESGLGWVEDNITACSELAKCYQELGERQKALATLLRSFQYDTPRGEICCQVGYHFKFQRQYWLAIFWFELALKLEKPKNSWGFHQEDYWNYIPSIECAVCYDNLGEYKKAEYYNELAAEFKPDSPSVLYNRIYFENRKKIIPL